MLRELYLENFRCFQKHKIPFKKLTIIVGKNNAGKSTVVEALRILSFIIDRVGNHPLKRPPEWANIAKNKYGISPSIKEFELFEKNLFFAYGDPPALIKASFTSGHTLEIYLGFNKSIHAVLTDRLGQVLNRLDSKDFSKNSFETLPQIGPIPKEEVVLTSDYVKTMLSSHLASSHFRNQLNLLFNYFPKFKLMAENSWPKLKIIDLEGKKGNPRDELALLIQDGSFAAECSWMGHGLQMWLQTIWFLVRTEKASTVVLDEPDVYLHADLQRKLIRLLRERDRQTIVCTHSLEIMSEAYPDHILIIDRMQNSSNFATNLPAVQAVLNNLGSATNIHLTRLWTAKKAIIVEGNDIHLLKLIQDRLIPNAEEPIDRIPNFSMGGWNGWNKGKGTAMALKNSFGEDIITYCLFDADYHPNVELESRYLDALENKISLHIWRRKELESYLINPKTVQDLFKKRGLSPLPTQQEIEEIINNIIEQLKDETLDLIANECFNLDRSQGLPTANKKARLLIESAWQSAEGRLSIVSGKTLISCLSKICKKKYDISFSSTSLARIISPSDVPKELQLVLKAIELGTSISDIKKLLAQTSY